MDGRTENMIAVRPAQPEDADAATNLLRLSIIELCTADHQGDAATLANWLANKTRENFLSWLAHDNNLCVVAEENGRLLGAGMILRKGTINLLYLLPGEQRRGIGRAIYLALEQQARDWGLQKLTLTSNKESRAFYESMGFRSTGDATPSFGNVLSWPYEKVL
jgi:GNAT superfamily N-acetyltransferase